MNYLMLLGNGPLRVSVPGFLILLSLVAACTGTTTPTTDTDQGPEWVAVPEFSAILETDSTTGVVVVFDPQSNRIFTNDSARTQTGYLPASTFKIFNSMVALETGVVADENETIPWDGVDRGWDRWNRDQNLRHGIRYSALWAYQELARRIGEEQMSQYVSAAGYGNEDISGGIDTFWLNGGMRITPLEQIELLVELRNGTLPFSNRTMSIVRDILILDTDGDTVLRGKTGWANDPDPMVGWFVGYEERGEDVYYFATEIDMKGEQDIPKRRSIAEQSLALLDSLVVN